MSSSLFVVNCDDTDTPPCFEAYGDPKWADWVLGETESIEHIRAAYDAGINTFDTADIYSCVHYEYWVKRGLII